MADIFIEAEVVSSGSLNGVMEGKNYARAMSSHKAALEASLRKLFAIFLQEKNATKLEDMLSKESLAILAELRDNPNEEMMEKVLDLQDLDNIIKNFDSFTDQVRAGHLGKTRSIHHVLHGSHLESVTLATGSQDKQF